MEESDRSDERVLTEGFIEKIDKLTRSPSERASDIWIELDRGHLEISNWDVICFSVETLGLMSSEFPWLREAAIAVNKLVYKAHYFNHDRIIESDHKISDKVRGIMNIPRMTDG